MFSKIKKILLFILLSTLSLFLLAAVLPYKVNTYKLTNSNQEIIFQEMVHVGDSEYYEKVNKIISEYKLNGYVFYYELIKLNNKEEQEEMNKLINVDKDFFEQLLNNSQLDVQHNHMNIINDNDINADVDSKKLITMLTNYNKDNKVNKIEVSSNVIDNVLSVVDTPVLTKAFLRLGLRVNNIFNLDPSGVSEVIIKQRNDILISKIYNNKDSKIVVQYGQFHYKDFEQQMKKQGFKSEIINTVTVF